MIENRRDFFTGAGLMVAFLVVLIILFSHVFNGKNGLEYLDDLYNSISKGSAYYIPKVREQGEKFKGVAVNMTLGMTDQKQLDQTLPLLKVAGAETEVQELRLKVTGDLGKILEGVVSDADLMYMNDGKKVSSKYGYGEKEVLFNWWKALKQMEKALTKQKKFKEADIVSLTSQKAVETSYNYYQIEPQKIGDKIGVVIFSLIFYVIYTVWYGYAILFMFEGVGLKFGH
jgi:hypothetical protein